MQVLYEKGAIAQCLLIMVMVVESAVFFNKEGTAGIKTWIFLSPIVSSLAKVYKKTAITIYVTISEGSILIVFHSICNIFVNKSFSFPPYISVLGKTAIHLSI